MTRPASPKVVLHIGQTKTGSTTLQAFLHDNWTSLRKRAVNYALHPHAESAGQLKPEGLVRSLTPSSLASGEARDAWAWLLRTIEENAEATTIISDEVFWHLGERNHLHRLRAIDWISRQLSHCDVRVVCYLRPQGQWVESWFNQLTKSSNGRTVGMTPESFALEQEEFGLLDYDQRLGTWADAFGEDKIIVRPWQRSTLVGGDIVSDFCDVVGLMDTEGLQRPPEMQRRLSAPALALTRLYNEQEGSLAFKEPFLRLLKEGLNLPSEACGFWPTELSAPLDAQYEASNRRVAQRFCNREQLFTASAAAPARDAYPGLSVEELGVLVNRMFIAQQRTLGRMEQRIRELESQLGRSQGHANLT